MGSQAMYGALMGLGEGISGYGKTLTLEELRRQEDERVSQRQHSLQEIRQKYENSVRDETRSYNEKRDLEKVTPGSDIYEATEANRLRLSEEKQAQSLEQIDARSDMYGGGSNRTLASLNQSQWTPESFAPYMAEFNMLVDGGMDPKAADQLAREHNTLQPKAPAASLDHAGMNKSIDGELAIFLEQPDELKIQALVSLGEDEARLQAMSTMQLIELYKTKLYGIFERRGQNRSNQMQGLMNPTGGGEEAGQPDPLGLRK